MQMRIANHSPGKCIEKTSMPNALQKNFGIESIRKRKSYKDTCKQTN